MKCIICVFLSAVLLFTSCDYLDMVPEKDIETVETIFETRSNAEDWLVGVYASVALSTVSMLNNVIYLGSDEFVASELLQNSYPGFKISAGLQMSQEPYGDTWSDGPNQMPSTYESIRLCNIFIENIDHVYNMSNTEKDQWKAEIKALKAFLYFELVRRYGPIVLVPENLSVDLDISELRQPRAHVDTCFNAIVRLCDEAAEFLLPGNQRTSDRKPFFSKEAALFLKAKALLYAASPLFNGNEFYSDFKGKNGEPLFSIQYDHEKWRLAAEAADIAALECETAGHSLYQDAGGKGSDLLDAMSNIENSVISNFGNPEFILEWKDQNDIFKNTIARVRPQDRNHYNSAFTGCLSPSMKMVEMYYTENGLPIDADNEWDYPSRYQLKKETSTLYDKVVQLNTDVLQLHLRREPRFYACIAADRTRWQRGPRASAGIDYNLYVNAYKGEMFGSQYSIITTTGWQNINGYWWKKHSVSEMGNVNYTTNPNKTFPVMRLAEVYLMQAEAWNEYLEAPDDEHVYVPLNKVRKRAGIKDVVTAWKSYSKTPEKVDTREGMREIIRREVDLELAFEGHRFFNLRRWRIAHEILNQKQYGWNILGANAETFYNHFEGPIIVWSKCKFTAPRDYLFPIKAEEALISGLVQNPGW